MVKVRERGRVLCPSTGSRTVRLDGWAKEQKKPAMPPRTAREVEPDRVREARGAEEGQSRQEHPVLTSGE